MEMNHLDKSDIDQEDVMKKDLFFFINIYSCAII